MRRKKQFRTISVWFVCSWFSLPFLDKTRNRWSLWKYLRRCRLWFRSAIIHYNLRFPSQNTWAILHALKSGVLPQEKPQWCVTNQFPDTFLSFPFSFALRFAGISPLTPERSCRNCPLPVSLHFRIIICSLLVFTAHNYSWYFIIQTPKKLFDFAAADMLCACINLPIFVLIDYY